MTRSRALVLQMSRLGDILQTTPTLRRMRQADPEREIDLVVIDAFSKVPVPGALFDRLHVFPLDRLRAMLLDAPHDWSRPLALLREFVADLGATRYDLAVNLTADDYAGFLMSLLPAQRRVGLVMNGRRQRAVQGGWMRYFWATARSRPLRAFNLVDMYSSAAGGACDERSLEMAIPQAAHERVEAWLRERGLGARPLVALQLGASEEIRRWPPERFAAMVNCVPDALADFVIVGTAAERALADEFLSAVSRAPLDAVGRTSLPELGALLERCRLLVTTDTGTMHVATAVATKVVELTFGPALVHETGPYGTGHLILEPLLACFPCAAGAECLHRSCHDFLDPRDAARVVQQALTNDGPLPRVAGGRLLRSRRAASGRVEYVPAERDQETPVDVWRRLSALVWEESLGVRMRGAVRRLGEGTAPASPDCFDSPEVRVAVEALDEVAAEAEEAARLVRRLPTVAPAQQEQVAARAHEHLQRLLLLGEITPACRPIVGFLRLDVEAADSEDLGTLAGLQCAAYQATAARARRLASLARASRSGS